MKKLLKKGWFHVLLSGAVLGVVFILLDNKFDFFSKKTASGEYQGPVGGDKKDMYITTASYSEAKYDFGIVKEGDTVKHVFKVKNTGKGPLFIYKANGTCDCIHPFVDKSTPLDPGEEREILVAFVTKGRKGPQSRTVLIDTNTDPAEMVLALTGTVE
ncbi:MAG: DUF1573 domain-containing protein [Bacteroidia bacterium]|nr:DUF1573 domain-containing protein [Bacteroidia bacterium]